MTRRCLTAESNAVNRHEVAVMLLVGVRHQALQPGTGKDGCRLKQLRQS